MTLLLFTLAQHGALETTAQTLHAGEFMFAILDDICVSSRHPTASEPFVPPSKKRCGRQCPLLAQTTFGPDRFCSEKKKIRKGKRKRTKEIKKNRQKRKKRKTKKNEKERKRERNRPPPQTLRQTPPLSDPPPPDPPPPDPSAPPMALNRDHNSTRTHQRAKKKCGAAVRGPHASGPSTLQAHTSGPHTSKRSRPKSVPAKSGPGTNRSWPEAVQAKSGKTWRGPKSVTFLGHSWGPK